MVNLIRKNQALEVLKSEKGQVSVETILLISLSVALFLVVSSKFRENQLFAQVLSKPWTNISSMIQNGVWAPKQMHPAHRSRWISVKGDTQP